MLTLNPLVQLRFVVSELTGVVCSFLVPLQETLSCVGVQGFALRAGWGGLLKCWDSFSRVGLGQSCITLCRAVAKSRVIIVEPRRLR